MATIRSVHSIHARGPRATLHNRKAAASRDWEEHKYPEESEDFSWNDALDVAAFHLALAGSQSVYPADLPVFLVRAMQQGPERVSAEELNAFYRRQSILGLKPAANSR